MVSPTREDMEAGMKTVAARMTDLVDLVVRPDSVAFEKLFDTAVHAKELFGKAGDPDLTHDMNMDNIIEVIGWSALAIAADLSTMQYHGGPLGIDAFTWFDNEVRPVLLARARGPRESRVIKCMIDRVMETAMGRVQEAARHPERERITTVRR